MKLRDSISARFAFTIFSNLARAALTFLTGVVVARGLGPERYGDFNFLLGSFIAIRQLLDAGTSTSFVTFISRRQRTLGFFLAYGGWVLTQFLIPLLAVGLILPDAWIDSIWLGRGRGTILLALAAVFLQQQAWLVLTQIGDSLRETYKVQGLSLAVTLAHLVVTVALWQAGYLSIAVLLLAIAIEYLLAIAVGIRLFAAGRLRAEAGENLGLTIRGFARSCRPLVLYSWFSFAYLFADNWLLRAYAGAVGQAYYAVAYQFAMLCALPTTAMLQIYWKEIAEAHELGARDQVAYLFDKVSRFLYGVGVAISCFLAPWAPEIIRILYGSSYEPGALVLSLMLVFAIHISLSQVASTLLLATGRAGLQARIGIAHMGLSILASYLVLAPGTNPVPGLGMGAEGMALKLIAAQLVTVNFTLWWIARDQRRPFEPGQQIKILVAALLTGIACKAATASWLGTDGVWGFVSMGLGAVLYGAAAIAVYRRWPIVFGLAPGELGHFLKAVIGRRA